MNDAHNTIITPKLLMPSAISVTPFISSIMIINTNASQVMHCYREAFAVPYYLSLVLSL